MNDRTATQERPGSTHDRPAGMTDGMSPMTQAGMTTGAGVTGWGVGAAQGGTAGAAAGGAAGAAGGGIIGWGVGLTMGLFAGYVIGTFAGMAIAKAHKV